MFHGDYLVKVNDGTELTLSRSYREKLLEPLSQFFLTIAASTARRPRTIRLAPLWERFAPNPLKWVPQPVTRHRQVMPTYDCGEKVFSAMLSFIGKTMGVITLTFFAALPAHGQESWSWPDKPSNLQVLAKDWPGIRLRPVMIGFTRALGVRCSYCHKGEEGKPLSTYDFASDDNPNKNRARAMLRMLNDIENDLKKIEPSGDQRVNLWCHTCHHGRPRPMTLPEELGEQYRKKGIKAALDYYDDLKKKYYGRGAYDFGEDSLNIFGYEILEKNDATSAIQVFQLNAELYPQSGNVWDSLAEAYMKSGDMKKAQENYEKAMTLDPKNDKAKEMLKKIKETKDR